ncbi:MAG TPA: NAD(P)H-dependent glycerol-3-phosphate dehydrogenase [Verrucomicrobiota bacterium]|nr:NAD(P)H-dependent glycerol-3-phosphate dehydrogenase [Verrucomicrobiota bacterium]
MRITVLGAGAWGTTLARHLFNSEHTVTLWAHEPARLVEIRQSGENRRYLPGVRLPSEIILEGDFFKAINGADCVLVAVPSKAFRQITANLKNFNGIAISVTKGIEYERCLTMSAILQEQAPMSKIATLSGPSIAPEVARGIPTAVVAASSSSETAIAVQGLFHGNILRVYTSDDTVGVELGGALKNVMAIAAGVSDGLGFGDNSKSALLTRCLVEMKRLGVVCGAKPETFNGLSGLGDLAVTFFSKVSRNRTFGERLGRGEPVDEILNSMVNVVEGYFTTRAAYRLARKLNVYTPIIDEVYSVLYEGKSPEKALLDLLSRDAKPE